MSVAPAIRRRDVFTSLGQPKVAVMLMLGFSSGLPFFLSGNTLGYWLRDAGKAYLKLADDLRDTERKRTLSKLEGDADYMAVLAAAQMNAGSASEGRRLMTQLAQIQGHDINEQAFPQPPAGQGEGEKTVVA